MYTIKDAFDVENQTIKIITLKTNNQIELQLLNYGATMVGLYVPDKNGKIENIVLSHNDMNNYMNNSSYFGATIGRTSGRIANGIFELEQQIYHVMKNSGNNHLHGGEKSFSHQVWDYVINEESGQTIAEFHYLSRDLEENYPGNLDVKVKYILTNDDQLIIQYEAKTDKKTICNLTNHAYFNLSGNYKRKVTEQYLRISSDEFLELNEYQVPTGKFIEVLNTPMDFNHSKRIGTDIDCDYDQLRKTNGYDHTWILKKDDYQSQMEMFDKKSGRQMNITTTYPAVVIYSYNYPGNEILQNGKQGEKYDGICFETQYEPDGINHPELNSAILDVNQIYQHQTIFQFSIRSEG